MSLIMDAQKAAQREKDRRAGADPNRVPLLVPLKTRDKSGRNWRPVLLSAVGVAAVAGTVWFVVSRNASTTPRALRTPGPTIASIATATAGEPPLTDTAPPRETAATSMAAAPPASTKRPPSAPSASTVRKPATKAAARPPMIAPDPPREKAVEPRRTADLRVAVDNPRSAEIARLFSAGVAAHRAGDLTTARSAYGQVLAMAPNDIDALNNLGVLYTSLQQYDNAEAALRRAVAQAPSNAGAWANLGTLLRERGRTSDAIAAFQHALTIDPRHPGARVGLAQQYIVIGSLAQAKQHLDAALLDSPTSPEANYAMGQVRERLGDRAGAVEAYSMFVRVAPPSHAGYVDAVRRRIEALTDRTP